MKNLAASSVSLLAKWWWRFLAEKGALWHDLLARRHGHLDWLRECQTQFGGDD